MAIARSERLKQYRDLAKNLKSFTQGQVTLVEDGDDLLQRVRIDVTPSSGPYHGGRFKFTLELTAEYPLRAPIIRCLNRVYHPNIDVLDQNSDGDVCLEVGDLQQRTLEDYVHGVLFLFYNPNREDPINAAFDGTEEESEFLHNVRLSMRGETIDGFRYDYVLADGYALEDEDERLNLDGLTLENSDDKENDEEEIVNLEVTKQLETTGTPWIQTDRPNVPPVPVFK